MLAVSGLSLLCGCAEFRLPAIDPSGRSIFLPAPNYTTLTSTTTDPATGQRRQPLLDHFQLKGLRDSRPAFESPPDPRCELPPLAPNQIGRSTDICPPPASDPTSPRVVVPGVCQDPALASATVNQGCMGQPRQASNPAARVTLSPQQHVAMVGSEVVLVGGVCGEDGYYRMREPLEWAISQGSVGHFVEPGQPTVGRLGLRGRFAGLLQEPLPELLSNNYAYGCTSRKAQVITKGTVTTSDDVIVHKGQGWISVTSPMEGTTYITLMAPDLDGWEQRKQTAVIHWVDGQWTLPPSAVVRGIEPYTLTTTVSRRVTRGPLSGWTVRYQILDPTAMFDDGTTTREVPTDATGQASIQIVPVSPNGGLARIKVQVIRPPRGGTPDQLIVGEGTTSVNWTTSTLAIQMTGPESVNLNENANYRVQVDNPGTIPVENVVVQSMLPQGFDFVTSSLPAQVIGSRLDWNLGTLGPGQQRIIELTYRATQGGSSRHCVSVQATGVSPIEDCLTTNVNAEALYIEMTGRNPEAPVPVGQELTYKISVYNRGNTDLPNVTLTDRFDAGLRHPAGLSPVEWEIGAIAAGQMREVELRFTVIEPGRQCHTLEATAPSTPPAQISACVTAVEREDLTSLEIRKSASRAEVRVGEQIEFEVLLINAGTSALSNLTIVDAYDPELQPRRTTPPESSYGQDGVVWYVSSLEPGEERTFRVTCEALYDVRAACSRVIVRNADGLERTDEQCVAILPAPATGGSGGDSSDLDPGSSDDFRVDVPSSRSRRDSASGVRPIPGANSAIAPRVDSIAPSADDPSTGSGSRSDSFTRNDAAGLELTFDARGDRWQVGDEVEYLIVITNNRNVADSNVVLTVELPNQIKLETYSGPVPADDHSADWRTMQMKPIRTVRAGETIRFAIVGTVVGQGEMIARAVVQSIRTPEGVAREDIALASP